MTGDAPQLAVMAALRLVAGMCQFSAVLYITGALSLSDLGDYTVFVILLTGFAQFAGFSFSTFLIRELGVHPRTTWPSLLLNQFRFLSVSYLVALVVAVVAMKLGLTPAGTGTALGAILLFTLANSACENYLVGAGFPLPAALSVLLRAAWIAPLGWVWSLQWFTPSLGMVLRFWLAGEALATLVLAIQIRRAGLLSTGDGAPSDRAWILRGCRVGMRHTMLSLLLLLTVSVQRIVLGYYHSSEDVGIFHFFFVISVFAPNLLEASLYALILPRLIGRHQESAEDRLHGPPTRYFFLLIGSSAVALLMVALGLPIVLRMLGKTELMAFRYLLAFTGSYALLYLAARTLHYQLYAASRDRALTGAYSSACVIACLASFALIPRYGLHGAAVALLVSGAALLLACAVPFVGLLTMPRLGPPVDGAVG